VRDDFLDCSHVDAIVGIHSPADHFFNVIVFSHALGGAASFIPHSDGEHAQ
jgi:hypothetical protein